MDGLLFVKDWPSGVYYVFTGTTGPLGRPIALLSFLVDAHEYPYSPAQFFYTNTLIHLVNVALVALVLIRLQRLAPTVFPISPWFVTLTAGFWGVLPILVSTSMMVVQRMTSLSALFVLLGIWLYLWGRSRHDKPWPVAVTVMGVGLCTLLAAYTKEIGVLLPVYLVILELTLGRHFPKTPGAWPALVLRWAIALPSLAVVGYLLWRLPGISSGYVHRPFDLTERLATQTIILWDYLRLGFLPQVTALHPYHDDYPIRDFGSPLVWLASVGWVAAVVTALVYRRTVPLLAFAVFWYLGGHLIESTIIPLELYFEHRNYLPILGPVLALAVAVTRLPLRSSLTAGAVGLYLAFLIFVLFQTLSIWGSRHHEFWAQHHPDSPRAVQMLAQAYFDAGQHDRSLQLLEATWQRNPKLSSVGMQALRLRCLRNEPEAFRTLLGDLDNKLGDSNFSSLTLHAFERVEELHRSSHCPEIRAQDIHGLADALLSNPRFAARGASRQRIHSVKAKVSLHAGYPDGAIAHLRNAIAASANQENVSLLYALLLETGQSREALLLLDEVEARGPRNRLVNDRWLAYVEALRAAHPDR